ncbi:winged helix-turn-helix transcriptional regulator [Actinospica durhamensis]|uniref:Winged helix-turn-helix transcriptional regulator n=1 Tax=Actinospica durhamensis TaxID=1508375 RepID=A0A941F1I3_9ACTN|nr:winged helix-turn-helix domain-containing protein [Actinospica durhamensis]MBR7839314.1 winged helix-turn-helix transcriptional regulator [Actinospica durhamensis]
MGCEGGWRCSGSTSPRRLRVRFAGAPAPLLELGLALAALQHGHTDPLFAPWRRSMNKNLPHQARPLFELVPSNGAGPLFLDPVSEGLEDGLDAVRSSSPDFVSRELRRVCMAGQPVTPRLRQLDARDRDAWQGLEQALRSAHHAVVEPSWSRIRAGFRADIAWRSHLIAELGLAGCLTTLFPRARWNGVIWTVDGPRDRELYLGGHGLTLHPSAYWTGGPLTGRYPDGSTLLVYPALNPLPLVSETCGSDPLAMLLGRTRAAVLEAVVDQRSSGELAALLGVSAASVSEHTRTLREAGLVSTDRCGKTARHGVTGLGIRLLSAGRNIRPADSDSTDDSGF